MSYFIGIDWSMSCPAITIMPEAGSFTGCSIAYINTKKPKAVLPNIVGTQVTPTTNNQERFDLLACWAIDFISAHCTPETSTVHIEDYAFGAGSRGKVFEIGENGGMIKHRLWKSGYKINLLAPTALKKFATGKGTAKKEQMHEFFMQRAHLDLLSLYQPISEKVGSPVSDIVDSFFLADYGRTIGIK